MRGSLQSKVIFEALRIARNDPLVLDALDRVMTAIATYANSVFRNNGLLSRTERTIDNPALIQIMDSVPTINRFLAKTSQHDIRLGPPDNKRRMDDWADWAVEVYFDVVQNRKL